MCTAVFDNSDFPLFGRTLDLEYSNCESVILTPRRFSLDFLHAPPEKEHSAILGIGIIKDGTPLYYDATNESGVAVAALNFPHSCIYRKAKEGSLNLASFEVIPFILSHCGSTDEAKDILSDLNITNEPHSKEFPPSPLHWMISDKRSAIVVEATESGVNIYENSLGVLANEPPFPYHLAHLGSFVSLDSAPPENTLCKGVDVPVLSRGAGGFGLPGDFSSTSRFVRAVFVKNHTKTEDCFTSSVSRFFHILASVSVPFGCVKTHEGREVATHYTSCASLCEFSYHFTTYASRRIRKVSPSEAQTWGDRLFSVPLDEREEFFTLPLK